MSDGCLIDNHFELYKYYALLILYQVFKLNLHKLLLIQLSLEDKMYFGLLVTDII
jgi:hypothetical protein